MSERIIGLEPANTLGSPVREYLDGRDAAFSSLLEIRDAMRLDDILIIGGIAGRRQKKIPLLGANADHKFSTSGSLTAQAADLARYLFPDQPDLPDLIAVVYREIASASSVLDLADVDIIRAISARVNKAKQATLFKWNKEEGIAPGQQAKNRAKAVEVARTEYPDDTELPDIIDRVYKGLVRGTVALQQDEFARTRHLPEIWFSDFGELDLAA